MATRAKDYREDQSRKDWWDEKIWWLGITRSDLMWVTIGFILAVLYFKFLPDMDWVFGLRTK